MRAVCLVVAACLSWLPPVLAAGQLDEITAQIGKMTAAADGAQSAEAERAFPDLLAHIDPAAMEESDIARLSGMLADPDDRVRYWVAEILGRVGRGAIAAAPALRQALGRVNCRADMTSEGPILIALARVGAAHAASPCGPGMEKALIRAGSIPAGWAKQ